VNYFVYAIQSQTGGKIYIGQTDNLTKRIAQHNDPECKLGVYTKKNKGPWKLVYNEKLKTRKDAIKRERQLKSARGREFIHKIVD
jgi:putative endonuclease